MSDSLREIARLLVQQGAPDRILARTEALIAAEEARAWARLEPYRARLAGKKVLLITGGVKSWSVVAALQEIGIEIVGTSVKKSTREDKEKIKEIMGDDAHMIDDMTPREALNLLAELFHERVDGHAATGGFGGGAFGVGLEAAVFFEAGFEFVPLDGLQQVVDAVDFESPQRVFVVRGRENDRRLDGRLFKNLETLAVGEFDVHQNQVGSGVVLQPGYRGPHAGRRPQHVDGTIHFLQQLGQFLDGQFFVFND